MSLKQVLIGVRAVLQAAAPTFLRDETPKDASGNAVLPDVCIILDLITDENVRDFQSVYHVINLQVGAWTPNIADSFDLQEAARAILESHEWDMLRITTPKTDGVFRGVIADYSNLH